MTGFDKSENLNLTIGDLISYEVSTYKFCAKTQEARVQLNLYENGVARVRVSRNGRFDNHEYALADSLRLQCLDFLDKENEIIISTALMSVCIQKAPFRIRVLNLKGQIINEDDESFGISWLGEQVTNYKKLQPNERFIGLGEKTGPLDKKGRAYVNWNTDRFAYGVEDDPLYCSIPFYIGIHTGLAYGIFFNNSYQTHFNFGASNNRFSSFGAIAGEIDYFIIHQPTVMEIIQAYSRITGTMPLPPKWSLGYQQCRYSYYPDSEVINTARNFRDRKIPADAIVLDIHYMDQYKLFTWDNEKFQNPKEMINSLHEMGFKVVVMCDPGIKVEKGYATYESGVAEGVFVKYPDDTNYQGQVWPGWCHFPDFTGKDGREWWKKQLTAYTALDIDGYWNDMNEIATWGQSLPNLLVFDFDGKPTTAREARNVYGLLMSCATYNGAKANLKRRPFNLTRSGYAGIQRYAALWTGDNVATDEHMLLGIRMLLGVSMSGVSFCGFDTGGFEGNPDEKLFARWISIAAFTPFFRGHSNVNTMSGEPWTFGEHVEEISRNYINLRYRLLPQLYSLFHEASIMGSPIIRSLAIYWPSEERIYKTAYENQFLLGDSILVAPVSSLKNLVKVFLPEGHWYDLFTNDCFEGNNEIATDCPMEKLPVFVKSSAIVIMQPTISHTEEAHTGSLEVHLYKGFENSVFNYYEDDGNTFDYVQGKSYQRELSYLPNTNELNFGDKQGDYQSTFKTVKIYFHGFAPISIDGQKLLKTDFRHIPPLSMLDPFKGGDAVDYVIKDLQYYKTTLKDSSFNVTWNQLK